MTRDYSGTHPDRKRVLCPNTSRASTSFLPGTWGCRWQGREPQSLSVNSADLEFPRLIFQASAQASGSLLPPFTASDSSTIVLWPEVDLHPASSPAGGGSHGWIFAGVMKTTCHSSHQGFPSLAVSLIRRRTADGGLWREFSGSVLVRGLFQGCSHPPWKPGSTLCAKRRGPQEGRP